MNRAVGSHIRIHRDLKELVSIIHKLNLTAVQFFLHTEVGRYWRIDAEDEKALRELQAGGLYVAIHGSYTINLAHELHNNHPVLAKELMRTQRLGISNYVIHPGFCRQASARSDALIRVAHTINRYAAQFPDITFLLENTPHAGKSLGSDMSDFGIIRSHLEYPEQVAFCFDTAHAHVYGYDLLSSEGRQKIKNEIEQYAGRLALIHINDTASARASRLDHHALIADGIIHLPALAQLLLQAPFDTVPLITEPPDVGHAAIANAIGIIQTMIDKKGNVHEDRD